MEARSPATGISKVGSFLGRSAGKHTLKIIPEGDGSRVASVKLVPDSKADNFPVWFAQIDPDVFTTGMLTEDESGKCMVRTQRYS